MTLTDYSRTAQTGDLLFFWGRDWESRVIELGTAKWYRGQFLGPSHIAGVAPGFAAEETWLYESTTLCHIPCKVAGKPVSGVQVHGIVERVADYDGRVAVCAVSPECRWDTYKAIEIREEFLRYWVGLPYDMQGALESPRAWLRLFGLRHPDLGSAYCSMLWARILMVHNRLNWANPKWIDPANLMDLVLTNRTHLDPVWLK